ncbi:MAG: MYXO-CTERM sorting domain-containing protein [Acidimicrobiales bacterium]
MKETFSVFISAAGTYKIFFTSTDAASSSCGALITDVRMHAVPTTGTPLANPVVYGPAAGLVGLVGAAWYLRRRRRPASAIA